jgi:hypothetical protein
MAFRPSLSSPSVKRRRPANAGSGGPTRSVRLLRPRIPAAYSEVQRLTVAREVRFIGKWGHLAV